MNIHLRKFRKLFESAKIVLNQLPNNTDLSVIFVITENQEDLDFLHIL